MTPEDIESAPRRGVWWARPLPIALLAALAVLMLAFAPALWRMGEGGPATGDDGAPWRVTPLPGGGIEVFGLALPGTTLADARRRWGEAMAVAVMARAGDAGALESYVERHRAGPIEGRLILSWQAGDDRVAGWRASIEAERLDGGTLRHPLRGVALDGAENARLVGATFVAGPALDATMVEQRFGEPAERVAGDGGIEHWLYPAIGLAVLIDPRGKDLLQYVAPAEVERRLRAPLRP